MEVLDAQEECISVTPTIDIKLTSLFEQTPVSNGLQDQPNGCPMAGRLMAWVRRASSIKRFSCRAGPWPALQSYSALVHNIKTHYLVE